MEDKEYFAKQLVKTPIFMILSGSIKFNKGRPEGWRIDGDYDKYILD